MKPHIGSGVNLLSSYLTVVITEARNGGEIRGGCKWPLTLSITKTCKSSSYIAILVLNDGDWSVPVFKLLEFYDLRATASKYRESADSEENSDFLLLLQKDPFGELFSEIYFQSSSEFTVLWNLGKFKIQLNQPRWPMEFIQNCTFSTRQYRKMGTCLGFIFTQFGIYSLVILLS